jgi:nicotinamidase-related amidase
MLMNRDESVLLIVDVQERLAPAIHEGDRVAANCAWLAGVAARLAIPVVVTEHAPDKLGPTLGVVKAATAGAQTVTKQWFSAHADGCFTATAIQERGQVILCGTEAHVCVMQTALDLRWAGKSVFVVADATGSRDPANRELALARLRGHGVEIVSREMVAFEWLQRGDTPQFSAVNRDFIR